MMTDSTRELNAIQKSSVFRRTVENLCTFNPNYIGNTESCHRKCPWALANLKCNIKERQDRHKGTIGTLSQRRPMMTVIAASFQVKPVITFWFSTRYSRKPG